MNYFCLRFYVNITDGREILQGIHSIEIHVMQISQCRKFTSASMSIIKDKTQFETHLVSTKQFNSST